MILCYHRLKHWSVSVEFHLFEATTYLLLNTMGESPMGVCKAFNCIEEPLISPAGVLVTCPPLLVLNPSNQCWKSLVRKDYLTQEAYMNMTFTVHKFSRTINVGGPPRWRMFDAFALSNYTINSLI